MKLVFSDKKERHGLRHFGRVAGQAEKMERLRHAFRFGAGTFGQFDHDVARSRAWRRQH
jgi:hypothetical protein